MGEKSAGPLYRIGCAVGSGGNPIQCSGCIGGNPFSVTRGVFQIVVYGFNIVHNGIHIALQCIGEGAGRGVGSVGQRAQATQSG